MADISKIILSSGNTYDIKDATARKAIVGGIAFTIAWDGASISRPSDKAYLSGVNASYNYIGKNKQRKLLQGQNLFYPCI